MTSKGQKIFNFFRFAEMKEMPFYILKYFANFMILDVLACTKEKGVKKSA